MGRKKTSKARVRVRTLRNHDPVSASIENEWAQHEPAEYKNAPHSFILCQGKVGRHVKELMHNIRDIMEPYTASNLKKTKSNVLKDYVSIASYFHVTHMCAISRTQISPYLKICRIPRGPSLTFRILNYSLSRDVLSTLRKQVTYDTQFQHHPLLIMNNFSSEEKHLELVSTTFQNMFPPININKVQLRTIRRVLMLNYNEEDDTIDLRHYTVTYRPVGVSKGVKKLLIGKHNKIPNLGRCQDISDFLTRDGDVSESEAEDTSETVEAVQKLSTRGTKGVDEVAIKLVELGPRMKLQLIKIENGLLDGETLYHKLAHKTDDEKLKIRKERAAKRKLKEDRKKVQQQNVEKKASEKELHRKRCLEGMTGSGGSMKYDGDDAREDADWYRSEVGQDPDADTFSVPATAGPSSETSGLASRRKRPRPGANESTANKRPKVSKFAAVKEKAKQLKIERQKQNAGREKAANRKLGGRQSRFKGSGVYTKPSRSKMSRKKP